MKTRGRERRDQYEGGKRETRRRERERNNKRETKRERERETEREEGERGRGKMRKIAGTQRGER